MNVIVWLIDGLAFQEYDEVIFEKLKQAGLPVILAVNKIDRVVDKDKVFAFFAAAQERFPFHAIFPISALKRIHLDELESSIMELLPAGELIYSADQITDRPEKFLVAEIIREKLIRRLSAELPYELTVEIERYEELDNISKIYAIIWIERTSQKSIIIGTEGEMLKKSARMRGLTLSV